MKSKQIHFLFVAFLLFCVLSFESYGQSNRQSKKAQTPLCNPDEWAERTQNVVRTFNTILYVKSGIIAEITDENGNPKVTGSYLHIKNESDKQIEYQDGAGSPFIPLEPGGEELKLLPIYRSKKDFTPTSVRVTFHYKCDSNFPKQPNRSSNQATNNQTQQNNQQLQPYVPPQPQPNLPIPKTNSITIQPFPVGCWKFTYVDPCNAPR